VTASQLQKASACPGEFARIFPFFAAPFRQFSIWLAHVWNPVGPKQLSGGAFQQPGRFDPALFTQYRATK
jgi:hypothetical protein